eukprot:TRINITY_DN4580_c0_g2_i1.p1 TRINITY_DN4580_c0_g2~~TRINITY_DN4580_c0_g2_i1.p1  ORF type:complete len:184 (+),score=27.36 TRINITY_DN4580_c0_g2_i1:156-707(+)
MGQQIFNKLKIQMKSELYFKVQQQTVNEKIPLFSSSNNTCLSPVPIRLSSESPVPQNRIKGRLFSDSFASVMTNDSTHSYKSDSSKCDSTITRISIGKLSMCRCSLQSLNIENNNNMSLAEDISDLEKLRQDSSNPIEKDNKFTSEQQNHYILDQEQIFKDLQKELGAYQQEENFINTNLQMF